MTEEECDDMVPLLDEASEYARKLGESKEASLLFAQISNLRAHHSGFKRKNEDAIEYIGESIDIYRQHLPGSAELSNQLWKSGNLKYCVGNTKMGLREQTESLIILEDSVVGMIALSFCERMSSKVRRSNLLLLRPVIFFKL